jgi:hypothetical protein
MLDMHLRGQHAFSYSSASSHILLRFFASCLSNKRLCMNLFGFNQEFAVPQTRIELAEILPLLVACLAGHDFVLI